MNRYVLWILASIGTAIYAEPPKPVIGQRIKFSTSSLPASDLVAQIRKDANIVVEIPTEASAVVVPVVMDTTFWKAIETLAEATNCRVRRAERRSQISCEGD